jgi:DNA-binding MarR family transcriptional regulator
MTTHSTLLRTIGDDTRLRILELLLNEPATQRRLAMELDLNSGTVSRHMKALEEVGLVWRPRSHAAYELTHSRRTWDLLQSAAGLAEDLLQSRAESAAERARALRKSGMRRSAVTGQPGEIS